MKTDKGEVFLDELKDEQEKKADPLDRFNKYEVSDEEMESIANPEFIIDDFIVSGQLQVIVAKPGAGKTTIMFFLAGEMAAKGYRVIYVHADTGGGDSKAFHAQAKEMGIKLLLPDMKGGLSMDYVVKDLQEMNQEQVDLSKTIFIFDTYKKMSETNSKSKNKQILGLLRGLTAKGATIILLHHSKKYDDENGMPIYDGTGDIRADVDSLIYFIAEKLADGGMNVSVEPDKQRADLRKMTFRIEPDRTVSLLGDYKDIATSTVQKKQREKDRDPIERITEKLLGGKTKTCDVIEYCKMHGISERRTKSCLKRYSQPGNQLWRYEKGAQRNTKYYELI